MDSWEEDLIGANNPIWIEWDGWRMERLMGQNDDRIGEARDENE